MTRRLRLIAMVGFACALLATVGRQMFAGSTGFVPGQTNADGSPVMVINGVPENVDITNLTQKAEAGDVRAQAWLAMCLYDGKHGVTTNYVEAYKWATVACGREHKDSKSLVKELEVFMTKEQIKEGRRAAQAYVEKRKGKSN